MIFIKIPSEGFLFSKFLWDHLESIGFVDCLSIQKYWLWFIFQKGFFVDCPFCANLLLSMMYIYLSKNMDKKAHQYFNYSSVNFLKNILYLCQQSGFAKCDCRNYPERGLPLTDL